MSVIERCPHKYARWTCCGCGASTLLTDENGTEQPADGSGNLVPADQLAGAVEEVERLREWIADDAYCSGSAAVDEALKASRDRFPTAGGQSEPAEPATPDVAVEALGEIDVLINEVLDQWTWPIRNFGQMRGWLGRLSDAVKRGQGRPALTPPSSRAAISTEPNNEETR